MLPTRLVPAEVAPESLGEQLDAEQVRHEFFHDRVKKDWVLKHVAPGKKWYVGRIAVWYRGDVEAWYPAYVEEQQARAQARRRAKDPAP